MSSKKKAPKEKDETKAVKCHSFALESDKAAIIRSNDYPLASDAISINCGRPYGAMDPLDWTAARAWLDEVPSLEVVQAFEQYSLANLRRAKDNSLPLFRLRGAGEEAILRFAKENWSRRQLQKEWQKDIVQRLGSLTLYPRHSVAFTYDAVNDYMGSVSDGTSLSAITLGNVIRRLLHAHCEWCNHQRLHSARCAAPSGSAFAAVPSMAYHPEEDFQRILGHSIRCTGFVTSLRESREVAFNYRPPDGEEEEEEEETPKVGSGSRSITMTSHYNATYINVCCGKNFYILPVLDAEKRRIKPASTISAALDLIYEDAREREAALQRLNVSEEVRNDLEEFYSLLARMTATSDDVGADIYRRLCEASEVNAHHLDLMEGALFTVVLDGSCRAAERRKEAQWLRSVFSLYYQWDTPQHFYATCFATVSSTTLQSYLKKAMVEPISSGKHDSLSPEWKLKDCSNHSLYESQGQPPQAGMGETTATQAEKLFQAVDLWLPLKHRTALRPYPPIAAAPRWREVWYQDSHPQVGCDDVTVAQFCVAAILAVERILYEGKVDTSKARRPSVLMAFHHPQCTIPSVVSLLTRQMEEYLQALRSPSVLLSHSVQHAAAERGVRSVSERLQECVDTPVSYYGLSRSAFEWSEDEEPADVCVTFGLLTQAYQKGSEAFKVQSVGSELCIPSRLQINGTAAQVRAQKHVQLGDGTVRRAELGVSPGHEAMADTFSAAFFTELARVGQTVRVV